MVHQMNLASKPFELVLNEQKKVEMRLNTPERRNIHIGDTIVFTNQDDGRILEVLVLNIQIYPSFKELYANNDKSLLGYDKDDIADPDDMLIYYKQENIDNYGVLGITIKLI